MFGQRCVWHFIFHKKTYTETALKLVDIDSLTPWMVAIQYIEWEIQIRMALTLCDEKYVLLVRLLKLLEENVKKIFRKKWKYRLKGLSAWNIPFFISKWKNNSQCPQTLQKKFDIFQQNSKFVCDIRRKRKFKHFRNRCGKISNVSASMDSTKEKNIHGLFSF